MPSVAKKEWKLMDVSGLCNVCEWVIQKVGMQEVNSRWFWVSAPLIMATCTNQHNCLPSFNIDYYFEDNYFGCANIMHWDH